MEKERPLGKNGTLYLYDEFEGDFSKNLREYLIQLGRKFAKHTLKYLRTENDDLYPFIFREQVLKSVFLPSLKDIADNSIVLMEYPIERKSVKGSQGLQENRNGRLDFYTIYKNKDILIELKFVWLSYRALKQNKGVKQELINKVIDASKQIKDIEWEDSIKIAIVVLPVFWYEKTTEENFKNLIKELDEDNFSKIYDDYFEQIKRKFKKVLGRSSEPFLMSWNIPNFAKYYLHYDEEEGKEAYEAYPAIFFIGAVLK